MWIGTFRDAVYEAMNTPWSIQYVWVIIYLFNVYMCRYFACLLWCLAARADATIVM